MSTRTLRSIFAFSILFAPLVGAVGGASAATKPPAPLGPATKVKATAGASSAVVSWTAPKDTGGVSLSSYKAISNPGNKSCSTTPPTTACTVSGLTNGTAYTFSVTVVNANSESVKSAASSAVTPTTAPGAPTAVSASAGNALATVSWTAPADNGGIALKSYTATSSPGSKTCTAMAPATTCQVKGLTNGTAYTFSVTATSKATSAASAPSDAVTPSTVPSKPSAPSAAAGYHSANVSWSAPSDGGSPITGYTVTSKPDSKTCTTTGATSCTVSGLTGGTKYSFSVVATNANGSSAASSSSSQITAGSTPPPPTGSLGASSKILDYESGVCSILTDKTVRCWGDNRYGQLGTQDYVDLSPNTQDHHTALPAKVDGLTGAASLAYFKSLGHAQPCALLEAGEVWCWGRALTWKDGTVNTAGLPRKVEGIPPLTQLDVGGTGTSSLCGVSASGGRWCWSKMDNAAQLNGPVPAKMTSNSCIVGIDDSGWCFHQDTATWTHQIDDAAAVAENQHSEWGPHVCFLKLDGTVWCQGSNGGNQVAPFYTSAYNGLGQYNTPVRVEGVTGAAALVLGAGGSCALLAGGGAKCWGLGTYPLVHPPGHLPPSSADWSELVELGAHVADLTYISGVTALSIEGYSDRACASDGSGTWCWGSLAFGASGDGIDRGYDLVPYPVEVKVRS